MRFHIEMRKLQWILIRISCVGEERNVITFLVLPIFLPWRLSSQSLNCECQNWQSNQYQNRQTCCFSTNHGFSVEEDKNRKWGLTGFMGPWPWAKRMSRAHPLWNSWWNKGPIWIGQIIGKILREHLKDRGLFTMNNLSTTFRISRGRVLQGNNFGYKERRQNLTTIKAPIPPHIKVRIIDHSLAL